MQTQSESGLREAAEQDSLTGVHNRATFRRHLAATIDSAARNRAAVLLLDLDDFKPVHDRFGHAAGDAVLRIVTARLRSVVRPEDIVARLGGAELGVLLIAHDSARAVSTIARTIVETVRSPISIGNGVDRDRSGATVRVSVSVGGTSIHEYDTVDNVLGRADRWMYEAKRCGGGQVRIGETVG